MRCGIGLARRGVEIEAVDDVAAIGRQGRRRSCVSVSDERGLANWPAMRPTLTTGQAAPKVSTTAICSSTLKVSRMLLGWNSAKLSAQSPPCSRNALPAATSASRVLQAARLAGEDQRRIIGPPLLGRGQFGRIGIVRHLLDRLRAPGVGGPAFGHGTIPPQGPDGFAKGPVNFRFSKTTGYTWFSQRFPQ